MKGNDWIMGLVIAAGCVSGLYLFACWVAYNVSKRQSKSKRKRQRQSLRVEEVTEERIGEMLAGAGTHAIWKATMAVIELEVQEGVEGALDESLSEGQLRWRLGGVEGLLALKKGLMDREEAARRKQREEEE